MNAKVLKASSLILVVVSLVVIACAPASGNGAKTTYAVDLADFKFAPNSFVVPAGKEITLNVANKGANIHEFVIMKAGTKVEAPFGDKDEGNIYWEVDNVQAGESKTEKFTAPSQPGTYQIICGEPNHLEMGMVGTLTVVAE